MTYLKKIVKNIIRPTNDNGHIYHHTIPKCYMDKIFQSIMYCYDKECDHIDQLESDVNPNGLPLSEVGGIPNYNTLLTEDCESKYMEHMQADIETVFGRFYKENGLSQLHKQDYHKWTILKDDHLIKEAFYEMYKLLLTRSPILRLNYHLKNNKNVIEHNSIIQIAEHIRKNMDIQLKEYVIEIKNMPSNLIINDSGMIIIEQKAGDNHVIIPISESLMAYIHPEKEMYKGVVNDITHLNKLSLLQTYKYAFCHDKTEFDKYKKCKNSYYIYKELKPLVTEISTITEYRFFPEQNYHKNNIMESDNFPEHDKEKVYKKYEYPEYLTIEYMSKFINKKRVDPIIKNNTILIESKIYGKQKRLSMQWKPDNKTIKLQVVNDIFFPTIILSCPYPLSQMNWKHILITTLGDKNNIMQ